MGETNTGLSFRRLEFVSRWKLKDNCHFEMNQVLPMTFQTLVFYVTHFKLHPEVLLILSFCCLNSTSFVSQCLLRVEKNGGRYVK